MGGKPKLNSPPQPNTRSGLRSTASPHRDRQRPTPRAGRHTVRPRDQSFRPKEPGMTLPSRTLGTTGLTVSAEGLGCMGMAFAYGATDDAESIRTIHRALDLGVTFLDTSDMYGPHTNERLIGRAIKGRRDEVTVATKFGIRLDPNDP